MPNAASSSRTAVERAADIIACRRPNKTLRLSRRSVSAPPLTKPNYMQLLKLAPIQQMHTGCIDDLTKRLNALLADHAQHRAMVGLDLSTLQTQVAQPMAKLATQANTIAMQADTIAVQAGTIRRIEMTLQQQVDTSQRLEMMLSQQAARLKRLEVWLDRVQLEKILGVR